MRTIRSNLTFTFDPAKVSERDIKDRLDAVLLEAFGDDVDDVHTRWVEALADSPLFGAARQPEAAAPEG